jgi:hypothetical protein
MSWWAYFPLPTGLVIFLLYNIKTKAYSQYIYRHRNFFTGNPGNTPRPVVRSNGMNMADE